MPAWLRRVVEVLSQLANASLNPSPLLEDGDEAFDGVNMQLDPSLLPSGTLAESWNKRLRYGTADTRPGISAAASPPTSKPYHGSAVLRIVQTNGATIENLIIAVDGANNAARKVLGWPDPNAGINLSAAAVNFASEVAWTEFANNAHVEFVQAIDKIYMLRGEGPVFIPSGSFTDTRLPWVLDTTNAAAGWNVITGAGAGTVLMPSGDFGIIFQDRLLVVHDKGRLLAVSDNLKYWQYDNLSNDLYIEGGDPGGRMTALVPFQTGGVVVFKEHRIHFLSNFAPDSSQAELTTISNEIGCVARKSVVQFGNDILFLSRRGIERLSQVFQDRIQATPIPVSQPIQPFIDKINWNAAAGAVATAFGELYVLAVPASGAATNSYVIVFNTVTSKIESIDYVAALGGAELAAIDALHVLTAVTGDQQLYALDYARGYIARLYDPAVWTDTWNKNDGTSVTLPILDRIATRGYPCAGFNASRTRKKKFRQVRLAIGTSNPNAQVLAVPDGVGEAVALGTITKSKTRSYLFGKGAIDPAAHQAKAEDYDTGELQESIFRRKINVGGRYLQVSVTNASGGTAAQRCNVRSVTVEAKPMPRSAESGA